MAVEILKKKRLSRDPIQEGGRLERLRVQQICRGRNQDWRPAGVGQEGSRLPAAQNVLQDLVPSSPSLWDRVGDVDIADQGPVQTREVLVLTPIENIVF